MQISNIYVQSGAAEWAKKASGGDTSTHEKKEKDKTSKALQDKVSISSDAGKSSSAEALVTARANALPEIREEKIALAEERIESGYYNKPEFGKEFAEHVVNG